MDTQVQKGIDEGLANFTSKYDLDTSVVDDLRQMLLSAMRNHVKVRAGGATKAEGKRPRLKTGYNLYIRAKFEEAKSSGDSGAKTNSQELMASFSKEWKDLSDEARKPYIEKADAINAENGADTTSSKSKKSGKKSLSGYNLFYSENKDDIRNTKDKDLSLMKAVGAAWKALSEDEQASYKSRAAEMSNERAEEAN